MLEFQKVTRGNFNELKPFFARELKKQAQNRVRLCELTPGSVYMWHDAYDSEFAVYKTAVLFRSKINTSGTERCYSYPIGSGKRAALKALARHIERLGETVIIDSVGEGTVSEVARELFVHEAYASRDRADYIYLKSEFENPAGRKHHKRKNLINRFAAEHTGISFEKLTQSNMEETIRYFEGYAQRFPESTSVEEAEYASAEVMLRHFDFSIYSGGLLRCDGKIVGLTVGEVYGDTVYIHIEKAEKDIPGAYQTLNRAYLLTISDPKVKYVNREEDMGLPGLRRSKLSYCPAWLEYKYVLKVSKL